MRQHLLKLDYFRYCVNISHLHPVSTFSFKIVQFFFLLDQKDEYPINNRWYLICVHVLVIANRLRKESDCVSIKWWKIKEKKKEGKKLSRAENSFIEEKSIETFFLISFPVHLATRVCCIGRKHNRIVSAR